MTKEKAIEIFAAMALTATTTISEWIITQERKVAVNMAIKALEQPEVIRCKDCSLSSFDKLTNLFYCNVLDIYKEPEFYCGYARGREE